MPAQRSTSITSPAQRRQRSANGNGGRPAGPPPRPPVPRSQPSPGGGDGGGGREHSRGVSLALAAGLLVALIAALAPGGAHGLGRALAKGGSAPAIAEGPTARQALTDGWVMARDPGGRGQLHHWQRGTFAGSAVRVPSSANPSPITGAGGVRNYAGSVAWYRTALDIDHAGRYALRFESVNHRATVWLDGHRVGGHVGEYLPFEIRFQTSAGPHVLVVRADWRSPDTMSREGFHRTWFNFGGINREVTIRPLGDREVSAPQIHTVLGAGRSPSAQVDVRVRLRNYGQARRLSVSGSLQHDGEQVDLHFPAREVPAGGLVFLRARVTIKHPALWAPGQPNLYDLHLRSGDQSEYRAKVGVRQLSWSHGLLYLNGRRLLLRGASLQEDSLGHGDALTPADQDQLVSGLRAIGSNATRSQHPLDQGLLERLDAAGIVVWQGVGPVDAPGGWTANTPALARLAEKRVRITVRQAQAHPAIIAWNLANEVAGNGHRGGQARYIQRMSRLLHHTDPGRLVAVDIWGPHPPATAGPTYAHVDAIGETNYLGWYEQPLARPAALAALIQARLAGLARAFAGRVLVVSEFGAEANYLNPADQPGGYAFQSRLLALHMGTYARDPRLSGMLIWNLRDFAVAPTFAGGSIHRAVTSIRLVKGLNQKGLFTYQNQAKPAVSLVRREFAGLPR